jgi:hypothetical protein
VFERGSWYQIPLWQKVFPPVKKRKPKTIPLPASYSG